VCNHEEEVREKARGQLRPIEITRNYTKYAEGSVLISSGDTRIICTASVEDGVPYFLRGENQGWLTAEYSMLPRATQERNIRAAARGKIGGRTREIQRLIGRSLRAVLDLSLIGERTIWIDCDVIQADGGTRTTSITGAFVALYDAVQYMLEEKKVSRSPLKEFMAAVSAGIVENEYYLDLCYQQDHQAQVDLNVVMTESGRIIEVQGTAEKEPYSREDFNRLLDLAEVGIQEIISFQKSVLEIEDEQ